MEQSVKSPEVINEESQLKQQDSMNNRFARYVGRVRNLEVENRERCLKEVEGRLTEQHEVHTNAIQELHQKFEDQMTANREEIEDAFAKIMLAANDRAQQNRAALSETLTKLQASKDQYENNNDKIVILEQINLSLHNRIGDLHATLEKERDRSAKSHAEIDRLHEEIRFHAKQYRRLTGTRKSLTREIAVYEKLLSDAEKPVTGSSPDTEAKSEFKIVC